MFTLPIAVLCIREADESMIREKSVITLFRFDSETGSFSKFIIKNAMLHYCRTIGEGFRGIKGLGQTIIRVKLKNPQEIYCGDKIVIGRTAGGCPPDAMTVVSVTDNNKGSSYIRHYKIICEG